MLCSGEKKGKEKKNDYINVIFGRLTPATWLYNIKSIILSPLYAVFLEYIVSKSVGVCEIVGEMEIKKEEKKNY